MDLLNQFLNEIATESVNGRSGSLHSSVPRRDGPGGQPWFQGESVTQSGPGDDKAPGARLLDAEDNRDR